MEGGPTFYGTPQNVTFKGLTDIYKNNQSAYNKAHFALCKDGRLLYEEEVKFSRADWLFKTPVQWTCTLAELGDYKVQFYHVYDGLRVSDMYEASFSIAATPKANPMNAKAKTVTFKYAKVKKKTQSVKAAKAFTVKKAKGKVTYKVTKYVTKAAKSKVKVASNGKVTVKKGTKKGAYKLKVKVTAAGSATYKSGSKTVTLKVMVK